MFQFLLHTKLFLYIIASTILFPSAFSQHYYSSNNVSWFTTFLLEGDEDRKKNILNQLEDEWIPGYAPFLVELIRFTGDDPNTERLKKILFEKMEWSKDMTYFEQLQRLWKTDDFYPYYYFDFKAELYKYIDPKFEKYFAERYDESIIRLDEVVWGGVRQDGIPPLKYPNMIPVEEAKYLNDSDEIFGVYINGEAKAYPKRILGWHEMAVDKIGGSDVALVYCTLCGSAIAYNMKHKEDIHKLGTSGFLYRSNKLMYDQATQSLWNTIEGIPVIGPLVDKDIRLESYPVETTTWSIWKNTYPETQVLSLNTGHDRDYSEGAAYQSYFASDELMFPVKNFSNYLPNKELVFVIRSEGYEEDPLAISKNHLRKNPIIHERINGQSIVIISYDKKLPRAYLVRDETFLKVNGNTVKDDKQREWQFREDCLIYKNRKLDRIPSHEVFWFGWFAQYPHTRLLK